MAHSCNAKSSAQRWSRLFLLLILVIAFIYPKDSIAQTDTLKVTVNLKGAATHVEILLPDWNDETLIYTIPIVQYANYDASSLPKMLSNFKAEDENGNELPTSFLGRTDVNIRQANKLHRISYQVNEVEESELFAAAGSARTANGSQLFNHNNYYGYFKAYIETPYQVSLILKDGLYPATNLARKIPKGQAETTFYAKDYYDLFDHPILIARPDTASFYIKGTQLKIASFSSNDIVSAQELADLLEPLVDQIHKMLVIEPQEDYTFLFYFTGPDNSPKHGHQFGGKMHSNSSVYVLPEISPRNRRHSLILRLVAHEYLHLLAPYHLRSHNMQHLNFVNSPMSRHLWFYEGAIEYFSLLLLYQAEHLSEEEFLSEISEKVVASQRFKKSSMAQVSEMIFKKKNQEQFMNFYYRGALAAFGMDLLIREQSKGEKSLLSAVNEIARRYGPNEPFYDGDLIKEIAAESTPSVKNFYEDYIEGKKELPYQTFAQAMGYNFFEETLVNKCDLGDFTLKLNRRNGSIFFLGMRKNGLQVENGDYLTFYQGEVVDSTNYKEIQKELNTLPDDRLIRLRVIRDGEPIELSGRPKCSIQYKRHVFVKPDNPDAENLARSKRFFDP